MENLNFEVSKKLQSIIDKAIENNVGKIIIGKLKGINYNKTFVQVPIQHLANLITYKARLQCIGIKF